MLLETWIAYVIAVVILMSAPGPSQLLMLSNSMANGFKRSLATAAGDLTANALQMLAAGLGIGAVIMASEDFFLVIKWLGVCYLVWMGVNKIINTPATSVTHSGSSSTSRLWLQGFITSAANPKAVIFFAALFPLFIDQAAAFWPQFLILSITYLLMDSLFLALYGFSAGWVAKKIRGHARLWIDRLSGMSLLFAAAILGSKTASN